MTRHRLHVTYQLTYGVLIALCGMAFWLWATTWPEAMSITTYGYAAFETDAEIWALAYVAAGALVVGGCAVDRTWILAPVARAVAFSMLLIMSYLLARSAWDAPHGAPVVIFSALYFGPAAAGFVVLNLRDYAARLRRGGG